MSQSLSVTRSMPRTGEQVWIPLLLLLPASLILGVVFYLLAGAPLILVPIVVGVGASLVVRYGLWRGRIHDVVLGIALALLAVILIYAVYQASGYLDFRAYQIDAIQQTDGVSRREAARLLEQDLAAATGSGGLVGYYRFALDAGLELRSPYGMNNQQFSGVGVLAVWGLELLLLAIMVIAETWGALKRPFCAACGAYYGHLNLHVGKYGLDRLGRLDEAASAEFVRLLHAGHFEQAGAMLSAEKARPTSGDVLVERCPTCDASPITLYVYRKATQPQPGPVLPLTPQQYEQLTTFTPTAEPLPGPGMGAWVRDMAIVFVIGAGLLRVLAQFNR